MASAATIPDVEPLLAPQRTCPLHWTVKAPAAVTCTLLEGMVEAAHGWFMELSPRYHETHSTWVYLVDGVRPVEMVVYVEPVDTETSVLSVQRCIGSALHFHKTFLQWTQCCPKQIQLALGEAKDPHVAPKPSQKMPSRAANMLPLVNMVQSGSASLATDAAEALAACAATATGHARATAMLLQPDLGLAAALAARLQCTSVYQFELQTTLLMALAALVRMGNAGGDGKGPLGLTAKCLESMQEPAAGTLRSQVITTCVHRIGQVVA